LYKLVRRPPCWNSTARLARHARLEWLDKVERVESSQVEFGLKTVEKTYELEVLSLSAYTPVVQIHSESY